MTNNSKFLAPTHLQQFSCYENTQFLQDLIDIEWRAQIQSSTRNKRFKIKYYGEIFEEYQLICGNSFAPELIYAVDIETHEEILLFDGCKHGYDAMFCDEFSAEQIKNRPAIHEFKDQDHLDVFEVIVTAYHNIDYDEELEEFLNEDGQIELISGEIISEQQLKSDGFDFFQIKVINALGHEFSIFERELA